MNKLHTELLPLSFYNLETEDVTSYMNDAVIKACQRILDLEDFTIAMDKYCSVNNVNKLKEQVDPNECGTSFCIAGILAHQDGYPQKYCRDYVTFDYEEYVTLELLGDTEGHDMYLSRNPIFQWLFAPDWPDCLEQAKLRARWLLENQTVPKDFSGNAYGTRELMLDYKNEYLMWVSDNSK